MNFNDIKEMCELHDSCLKKTDIIENARSERYWLKVVDPRGKEFHLSKDEIQILYDHIFNKGLGIENKINEILKEE